MNAVSIQSGQAVEYEVLTDPCMLNTHDAGEFCAEAGHYVVTFPGNKPVVLTEELFNAQFTPE